MSRPRKTNDARRLTPDQEDTPGESGTSNPSDARIQPRSNPMDISNLVNPPSEGTQLPTSETAMPGPSTHIDERPQPPLRHMLSPRSSSSRHPESPPEILPTRMGTSSRRSGPYGVRIDEFTRARLLSESPNAQPLPNPNGSLPMAAGPTFSPTRQWYRQIEAAGPSMGAHRNATNSRMNSNPYPRPPVPPRSYSPEYEKHAPRSSTLPRRGFSPRETGEARGDRTTNTAATHFPAQRPRLAPPSPSQRSTHEYPQSAAMDVLADMAAQSPPLPPSASVSPSEGASDLPPSSPEMSRYTASSSSRSSGQPPSWNLPPSGRVNDSDIDMRDGTDDRGQSSAPSSPMSMFGEMDEDYRPPLTNGKGRERGAPPRRRRPTGSTKDVHPYPCTEAGCDTTHRKMSDLNVHIESVHQGIRWTCTRCGDTLSTRSNLARHRKDNCRVSRRSQVKERANAEAGPSRPRRSTRSRASPPQYTGRERRRGDMYVREDGSLSPLSSPRIMASDVVNSREDSSPPPAAAGPPPLPDTEQDGAPKKEEEDADEDDLYN